MHRADDVRPTSTSDVTSNTESEIDIVIDVNNDIQSVIEHDHTSMQATVLSPTTTTYFYCMKQCDVTDHDVVC